MVLNSKTSRFDLIGVLISLAVLLAGVFFQFPSTISFRTQLLFAIFSSTVVLWITKPIPYSVSSLYCVILLYAFGVTETFEQAVIGFASSLVLFLILLLLIGKSIARVDLDKWVSNKLITEDSSPRASLYRLSGTLVLLSFIMPSGTARTVTFLPIIDKINGQYGLKPDSPFRRAAYYIIGHVNHIGSTALMTGGGVSIVTAGLINSLVQPITWVEWALLMIPPTVSLFLLASVCGIGINGVSSDLLVENIENTQSLNPPQEPQQLTGEQKLVLATLAFAIFMWIIGSFLGIDAIIPAAIIVFIFYSPGVRVLSATDFKEISWGIIFLVGAMLSVLNAMEDLGAIELIADFLFMYVPIDFNIIFLVGILLLFAAAIRTIFSSLAAAIAILLPILLEFASVLELNQLYLSLSLMLVLVSTSLLPFNISTVLLAHERGPLNLREVFLLGCMTMAFSFLVVFVSWLFYWPAIEGIVRFVSG